MTNMIADQALEHLRVIAAAVKVPVNADFEGGFADFRFFAMA